MTALDDPSDHAVPAWLAAEIDAVPAYDAFAGVDELVAQAHGIAAEYPGLAEVSRCGTSQQGEPLWCLTIADPDHEPTRPEALAIGLPHPNEPIGGLSSLHLAARLCADSELRDRLGHRWHVVPCADPDGLRLNEGWLDRPHDRAHYARHFYRPAGTEQVEWTFPVSHEDAYFDRPIPETQAVMRLVDEHRPALLASLHNSELGGAHYYLSRAEPALQAVLKAVPPSLGIPLERGEPESSIAVRLDEAIYESPDLVTFHDRLRAAGLPWPDHGGSTTTYSARYGTLTILSELPYWRDPHAADDTGSGRTYAAVLAEWGHDLVGLGKVLSVALDATEGHLLAPDAPLRRAAAAFGRHLGSVGEDVVARSATPASAREATVAETSSLVNNTHAFRLRFGGMVLRSLEAELALGNVREPVRLHASRLQGTYDSWLAADAAAITHDPIEIGRLVAVQYAATAAAAAHLSGRL